MPVNYQLGKIYKMESPSGLIYIGSTCEPTLARRLAGHKRDYKSWKNGKFSYVTSFKLFEEDEDNTQIYLIKKFPCDNKDELHAEEGKTIKEHNCVNKNIAGRTKKEWADDNQEKIKEYQKEYYEKNKDTILEADKVHYQENKTKILEAVKQYREKNLEKIKIYMTKKHDCQCGGNYTTSHKAEHFKSKKHIAYMESQNK